MSKLHSDYHATRVPPGLQQRLLDDYADRHAQQRWLTPVLTFVALLVVGITVLQPKTLRHDEIELGRLATVTVGELTALTRETSSLSRLRISQLQLPKRSVLGDMPRMPSLPITPRMPRMLANDNLTNAKDGE